MDRNEITIRRATTQSRNFWEEKKNQSAGYFQVNWVKTKVRLVKNHISGIFERNLVNFELTNLVTLRKLHS